MTRKTGSVYKFFKFFLYGDCGERSVVRPSNAECCRHSIVADLALVLFTLFMPVWASLSLNAPVDVDTHSGTLGIISDGHGMSFAPATPGGAFLPADDSAFIEGSEEEHSDPFVELISPAFNATDGLHKARSGRLLHISHSRTVALPLRC
ncbi:hypothetical protein [Tautonia marina]|uniref:hypothetical protein n=1 Tax=Tautonia marina TaxID=2653855 RepID=UPI001260B948|nr:hypothetical protein [Tautonia marina]